MSEGPLPSRREREIAARLEEILEAASRLFAEKGFHRTTTKEIAQAADVSEGTLYNYFENKNELLLGILAHLAEAQDYKSLLQDGVSQDARQLFAGFFRSAGSSSEKHAAMHQAILSEILADVDLRQRYYHEVIEPTLAMLEKYLRLRIQLGQMRPLDAQLAARFVVSIWTGLFILQVLGDPILQSSWDEMSEISASILFDGVTPD